MSAAPLLRQLSAAGIVLSAVGDRLHVEAPVGIVTPELRQCIVASKADLLAELTSCSDLGAISELRTHLLTLAARHGFDTARIHGLFDLDVAACVGLDDSQLVTYLELLDDTATRRAGKVPPDHTAPIHCHHCGPVWVHPSMAACLPVVDGWPRALGCPWCAIRKAGAYIPRPPAQCLP